jgi:hypothetical protein
VEDFCALVRDMVAMEPAARPSLAEARRRLEATLSRTCVSAFVRICARDVSVVSTRRLPSLVKAELLQECWTVPRVLPVHV